MGTLKSTMRATLFFLAIFVIFALSSVDARRHKHHGGKFMTPEKRQALQECKQQCPECPNKKPAGVRNCRASCKNQKFSNDCRTCLVGKGLPGGCFDCMKTCLKV